MKGQHTDWEKIFANDVCDQQGISLQNSQTANEFVEHHQKRKKKKKKHNSIKKSADDLNRYFFKEDTQMGKKHM